MFFCIAIFKVGIIVQNVQEIKNCGIVPIRLSDLFCKTYELQTCLIKQIQNNGLECSLNITTEILMYIFFRLKQY